VSAPESRPGSSRSRDQNEPRRNTAHDRLLSAVSDVAAHKGYAHLTVERLLASAGVSRATFYQYFANVDDCFWSAYRHHADRLVDETNAAVGARRGEPPELLVLDALVDAAVSRPGIVRLLTREGLAAGPAGLAERDSLIARITKSMTGSVGHQPAIDLPAAILIGGTFRFLTMRLSDGHNLGGLRDDIRQWAGAFALGARAPGWSVRFTPAVPGACSSSPYPWGGTRFRGSARERILKATALTIRERGYRASTVADVVQAAGVSRRGFYNEFACKSAAFVGAYEHVFEEILSVCTPAFFGPRVWPERVWSGALAFTSFLAREPLLSYLGLVECYAVGPRFALRVHDTQLAFTVFLEEGYRQRPEAESLSRGCSALTVTAIFELAFQASRHSPDVETRRLQPLAVYMALAPFIGMQEAGNFVAGKLAELGVNAPAAA
jgi:AcrR family transcriptional regulator